MRADGSWNAGRGSVGLPRLRLVDTQIDCPAGLLALPQRSILIVPWTAKVAGEKAKWYGNN
jgi:hypothetical protein